MVGMQDYLLSQNPTNAITCLCSPSVWTFLVPNDCLQSEMDIMLGHPQELQQNTVTCFVSFFPTARTISQKRGVLTSMHTTQLKFLKLCKI